MFGTAHMRALQNKCFRYELKEYFARIFQSDEETKARTILAWQLKSKDVTTRGGSEG